MYLRLTMTQEELVQITQLIDESGMPDLLLTLKKVLMNADVVHYTPNKWESDKTLEMATQPTPGLEQRAGVDFVAKVEPVQDGSVFDPSMFEDDGTVALPQPDLDATKVALADLAAACGNKNACFRLIEHVAQEEGAGLSKVDPIRYGVIFRSCQYLKKYPELARRWAEGEDTTEPLNN